MSTQSQRLKTLMDSTKELFEKYGKDEGNRLSMSESSCSSSFWNLHEKPQKISDFLLLKDNKSNSNTNLNANRSNTSFVSKSESEIKDKSQSNISIATLNNNNENKKDKENSKLSMLQK